MKARAGDMIEVRGRHIESLPRLGEVLEVRGEEGVPPYLIQWDDEPHQCIYFPGTDAIVRHLDEEHAGQR